jgi:hypothetical protein
MRALTFGRKRGRYDFFATVKMRVSATPLRFAAGPKSLAAPTRTPGLSATIPKLRILNYPQTQRHPSATER